MEAILGYTSIIKDIVQILVLAYLIYKLYIITSPTPAVIMLRIIGFLLVFMFLIDIFRLQVLKYFFDIFFIPVSLLVVVLYQADLRHGFTTDSIKRAKKYKNSEFVTSEGIESILDAAFTLSRLKRGALIVIPRNIDIGHIIKSGTTIDANLSANMLLTIFDHDTPFHDGAVVIKGNKIVAAACYLTLSEQTNIRQTLGTRHRAALGLSEESDALILVVSEETKKVSICFNGEIKYDLSRELCERTIKQYMMFKNEGMPSFSLSNSDSSAQGGAK